VGVVVAVLVSICCAFVGGGGGGGDRNRACLRQERVPARAWEITIVSPILLVC